MNQTQKKKLGGYGEEMAAKYLSQKGYKILKRNFRTPFGEIDIIGEKKGKIYFFEIKTEKASPIFLPELKFSRSKKLALKRTAQIYLAEHKMSLESNFEFRLITIKITSQDKYQIQVIKNILLS